MDRLRVNAQECPSSANICIFQTAQEKEMATHFSILANRFPWTEEPGGLQSTGWQRVRHDLATEQQLLSRHILVHAC